MASAVHGRSAAATEARSASLDGQDDESGPVSDASTPAARVAKDTTLCGVCNVNAPKYRCPRCPVRYCSIACNRTHRENHPAEPESNPRADIAPVANKEELTSAQDPANPFRALDSSGRLRLLFQKYPNLPEQLLQIYAATQPPPATSSKPAIPESLMRGLPQKETWNHDLGVRSGKEALRKARKAGGRDGDAIREYSELILHLMDRDGVRNDATNVFERQVAQQDAKFIEQLMAREKHQG